jgi:hypothetical protein
MALASRQVDGYSGSTRLHLDLSDAVNLMVHSSPPAGTALWHIFAAVDTAKIREYLRKTFSCSPGDDPIHSQQFYLGPSHLMGLKTAYDVIPYVVEQAVGEAIFIPAGCAHQVSLSFINICI